MKINSLEIQPSQSELFTVNAKIFKFPTKVTIIYSDGKNSVGKTTLLRFLLFALGYSVPSTKGIDFAEYKTILSINKSIDDEVVITRSINHIEIARGEIVEGFSLPVELNKIHSELFGTTNEDILDNMLGAFYLDQEKGWTLLNRGKVIGSISFSIEALLRGLANKSDDAKQRRLSIVKREIFKYKKMLDVAAYQSEINKTGDAIGFEDSPSDKADSDLQALKCEKKTIEDESRRVKEVVRKNTNFKNYITSFNLKVKSSSGEEVSVNEKTIIGYLDNVHLLDAKQNLLYEQLSSLNRKILALETKQKEDSSLFNVQTSIQEFDNEVSKIRIDQMATQRIIAKLEIEEKEIESEILMPVKADPIVEELYKWITSYASELGIERYINGKKDFVFTNDLKSLSGAILHKIVFAFKLSYIKSIYSHVGIILPIIIDSPNGREVSPEIVQQMMSIIERDFPEHQVIIASIKNSYNFEDQSAILIEDRLLPF